MDAEVWFTISIIGYSLAGVLFIAAIIMFFKMNILSIIGDLSGRTAAKQIQMIREQNTLTGNKRHTPNAFNAERGKLTEPVGFRPDRSGGIGKTAQTIANESKRLDIKGQTVETSRPIVIESLPTMVLDDRENLSFGSEETTVLFEETIALTNGDFQSNVTEVLDHATEVLESGTTVLTQERGTSVLKGTEVLTQENGTMVLNATEVLTEENGTMVLNATEVLTEENGTTVLNETVVLAEENGTTVLNGTAELENEKDPRIQAVEFKIIKDIKITHNTEVI